MLKLNEHMGRNQVRVQYTEGSCRIFVFLTKGSRLRTKAIQNPQLSISSSIEINTALIFVRCYPLSIFTKKVLTNGCLQALFFKIKQSFYANSATSIGSTQPYLSAISPVRILSICVLSHWPTLRLSMDGKTIVKSPCVISET